MNWQYFGPLALVLLIAASGHAWADVFEIGDNGSAKVISADHRLETPTRAAVPEEDRLVMEKAIVTTKTVRAVILPPPPAPGPVHIKPPAALPVAYNPLSPAANPSLPGGGQVQLGAWRSQAEAEAGWTHAVKRAGGALAGFSPHIVTADLPKGRYYRLRVISDKESPKTFCASLIAQGLDCIPARD